MNALSKIFCLLLMSLSISTSVLRSGISPTQINKLLKFMECFRLDLVRLTHKFKLIILICFRALCDFQEKRDQTTTIYSMDAKWCFFHQQLYATNWLIEVGICQELGFRIFKHFCTSR